MSKRQLAALKLAGYRYSATRDAWVHRAFRGRLGPVFQAHDASGVDLFPYDNTQFESLFTAGRIPRMPPMEAEALPRRRIREQRRKVPVKTRLAADEPARLVHVDGRPPERGGILPSNDLPIPGRVVPIKSARASA